MATLPEIAEWVAGVYQIEENDPVLGGPPNESTGAGLTNIPALHLAKRTAFLKQVLDDAGIGATAAPAIADFNTVGASGLYQAASAANAPEPGVPFTLMHIQSSATQATQIASRITSDRVWVRRLAAGTWSAWREILHTGNAASILGNTPAQFDDSTALATTAFVQRALGNAREIEIVNANKTLTAADAGKTLLINDTITLTFPNSTNLQSGAKFTILNTGGTTVTLAGSTFISANGNPVTILAGHSAEIYARPDSNQYRVAHTGDGMRVLSSPGYKVFSSGLIIQWGSGITNASSVVDVTFPIAFPNAALSVSAVCVNGLNSFPSISNTPSATGFGIRAYASTDAQVARAFNYISIGH